MTTDYKILLDVPLRDNLALGFNELAAAFKDIIEKSDPQFAIGLFGGWGSGKTTLMEAIIEQLDKTKTAVVSFSAWRYEKEQHLIVPLLDVIREGLVAWVDQNQNVPESLKQTTKQVAATVGKAIASLLAGFTLKAGIPGSPEISYDFNKAITQADKFDEADMAARVSRSFYHASFQALRQAFSAFTGTRGERRIVVFIDDLDRCLPEGALEVLESMKLFFDLPGFVFVVGLDRKVVEFSVDKRYREVLPQGSEPRETSTPAVITGANYIRKIFQVPYSLAPVAVNQIDEFLGTIYDQALLPAQQLHEIDSYVKPHLRYLVDAAGVNPREIKRFINAYTLVRKIKPSLAMEVVLSLQTIAFRADWFPIQVALFTFREAFIDALKRHARDPGGGHLEVLTPNPATIPQSFLTYLEDDKPGHVLIAEAYDINEYLYSGESTRTSESTIFIDLFRDIGQLVGTIRKVFRGEEVPGVLIDNAQNALNRLRTTENTARGSVIVREINDMINIFGNYDFRRSRDSLMELQSQESIPMRERGEMSQQIEQYRQQLQSIEREAISHVRRAVTALQELYQAGTL
jgi:hypothetical protein